MDNLYGVYEGSYDGGGIIGNLYYDYDRAVEALRSAVRDFDNETMHFNRRNAGKGTPQKYMTEIHDNHYSNGMSTIKIQEFIAI